MEASKDQLNKIEFRSSDGKPKTLADYAGQVLLIVNVASKCGLTPQYEGLERLFEKYEDQGLLVLGFPANEFAGQEPGTNSEIQEFCQMKFGVQFPVLEKIVVKGPGQHALYKHLTALKPDSILNPDGKLEKSLREHGLLGANSNEIKWNFEKFLLNRKGDIVGRFAPDITPEDPVLVKAIETELAKK